LSTFATTSFDDVAHAQQLATPEAAGWEAPPPPPPPRVFQLYVLRDRERVSGLLSRAARAGFRHLVLTADLTW
jgi:isopentenyl diphosphate isomerase/L-lactate dehydrogenase-like FMN-dependent dehydrogenase